MRIQVHGHRGCRAYLPENTIPGFQRALEFGVDSLELDIVVSADHQLVVSHEPYFSSNISLNPEGDPILDEDQLTHNIYRKKYSEIIKYDVGSSIHPTFKDQENFRCYKPLLAEVFEMFRIHPLVPGQKLCLFNIEVKFHPELVGHFYPNVDTYVKLLVDLIEKHEMSERVIIQSFDYDILRKTRELNPALFISALNDKEITVNECFSNLGFTPDAFGPNFELLNRQSVEYCKNLGVKVIPWTVNKKEDIQRIVDLEVDGIISDYPDLVFKYLN